MDDSLSRLIFDSVQYLQQQAELYGNDLDFNPGSLSALEESVRACSDCPLSRSRTHIVFGTGNEKASLMLIGEAPGREEDLQGIPFVGQAGQLLDKILEAIGFERKEVYLANILKCRPPENRDPMPDEIECCFPYLRKQIELIRPRMILALGRIAAQAFLETSSSLSALRNTIHEFRGIPFLVTYHPAALLRNSQWKAPVWEDIQKLRHLYDERVGDKPKWSRAKK